MADQRVIDLLNLLQGGLGSSLGVAGALAPLGEARTGVDSAQADLASILIPQRQERVEAEPLSLGQRIGAALASAGSAYAAGLNPNVRQQDFVGQLMEMRRQQAADKNQAADIQFQDALRGVLLQRQDAQEALGAAREEERFQRGQAAQNIRAMRERGERRRTRQQDLALRQQDIARADRIRTEERAEAQARRDEAREEREAEALMLRFDQASMAAAPYSDKINVGDYDFSDPQSRNKFNIDLARVAREEKEEAKRLAKSEVALANTEHAAQVLEDTLVNPQTKQGLAEVLASLDPETRTFVIASTREEMARLARRPRGGDNREYVESLFRDVEKILQRAEKPEGHPDALGSPGVFSRALHDLTDGRIGRSKRVFEENRVNVEKAIEETRKNPPRLGL